MNAAGVDSSRAGPGRWTAAGLWAVAVAVGLATVAAQDAAPKPAKGFGTFTPAQFLKASRPFSPKGDAAAKKSWKAPPDKAGKTGDPKFLVCTGTPTGYLKTVQSYRDFELRFQWRYPKDENGNSGVLLHTVGPDKIWPKSIQVQLHTPKAGSILIHDGAKTDNMVSARDLVSKPKAWNTCVIVCRDGTLTVTINGKKSGTVTGCVPRMGQIALQSEGAEVHFRNIELKPAPKKPATKKPAT